MLCAACLAIFADPYMEPWHEGPHHYSKAELEKAAKNGCYLCSELLVEYMESESYSWTDVNSVASSINGNFHAQRRLDKSDAFTTYHLRQVTSEYGDLYYWFEETQSSSATFFLVKNHALRKPSNHDQYLQAARQDLGNTPWLVRDDGFDVSENLNAESTGEPEIAEVASKWLTKCLTQHPACNLSASPDETGWVPKRLLDVGSNQLRLILTKQTAPTERYATLSHCWGPNPSICRLDTKNSDAWQSSIPLDILTKTFRDAVITTRRMKIRYLWIDSLCILQDGPGSREDWLEHAVAMRSVYKNSILNIAVARASSGEEGAFATRSPAFVRPCHLQWKQRPYSRANDPVVQSFLAEREAAAVTSSVFVRPSEAQFKQGALHAVTIPDDEPSPFWTVRSVLRHSSSALRTLPLYTRAWVVQERFLAPRVLHFGDDRVMWECSEVGIIEESCPNGIPHYVGPDWKPEQWPFKLEGVDLNGGHLLRARAQEDSDPTRELWHYMIDEFTRCDLSFPEKDVFVAFAGIAEVFGQHYDHQYVAGFFRQHLPFALWWQNKGLRCPNICAPSWSWASIDGQVLTVAPADCPRCDRCCTRLVDVEDVRIDLVDGNNVYGQIKGAELILRGRLIPCKIEEFYRSGTGLAQSIALFPGLSGEDQLPARFLDEKTIWHRGDDPALVLGDSELDDEAESQRGSKSSIRAVFDRWALPLFLSKETQRGLRSEKSKHFGMVVKKNEDGKYARVGLYSVRTSREKEILHQRQSLQSLCLV